MSERFQELEIFFEHYLRLHQGHFLEQFELVGLGEIDLVLMLPLAPPLIESDRVVLERDPGEDLRCVTRKINRQPKPHELLEVLLVG